MAKAKDWRGFVHPRSKKRRAALLRKLARNTFSKEKGEVVRVDGRTCTLKLWEVSKRKGGRRKAFFRVFPTWRLHGIKADFVGAKIAHLVSRIDHDMLVSRLARIGPTVSLKMTRPKRRFTRADAELLDRMGRESEPDGT